MLDEASETTAIPIPFERLAKGDKLKGALNLYAEASAGLLETVLETDEAHGRIEQHRIDVVHEVEQPDGGRRFPKECRPPNATCPVLVRSRTGF